MSTPQRLAAGVARQRSQAYGYHLAAASHQANAERWRGMAVNVDLTVDLRRRAGLRAAALDDLAAALGLAAGAVTRLADLDHQAAEEAERRAVEVDADADPVPVPARNAAGLTWPEVASAALAADATLDAAAAVADRHLEKAATMLAEVKAEAAERWRRGAR